MKRKPWTADDLAAVRLRYPHESTRALAKVLGRTERAIYQQANKFGLRKSAEYLASDLSGRVQRGKQHPAMKATQFVKGQPAWNAGIKGSTGLHPNCRATHFKPGRLAHEARNYQPIGALRVTKDGLLERKVTDDPSLVPARRWVSVARLVWEAENGPAPRGHAVVFKPGCATTAETEITPDRIELVTRAELMRRNSYHNRYPKEVAQLIQLRGALNRKLNRRNREESHV